MFTWRGLLEYALLSAPAQGRHLFTMLHVIVFICVLVLVSSQICVKRSFLCVRVDTRLCVFRCVPLHAYLNCCIVYSSGQPSRLIKYSLMWYPLHRHSWILIQRCHGYTYSTLFRPGTPRNTPRTQGRPVRFCLLSSRHGCLGDKLGTLCSLFLVWEDMREGILQRL